MNALQCTWNSAIYEGVVRHRRFRPVEHTLRFPLFMMYLDLAELPALFDRRLLWSARRPALAWFRRADYLGPADIPLDQAVRDEVERHSGQRPDGPIRMLAHLRYFGHVFNPVTFYYCFDAAGNRVESIAAQITNTPWKERHTYVLSRARLGGDGERGAPGPTQGDRGDHGPNIRSTFGKAFHVSPFMPMEMAYDWTFTEPGDALAVHMRNLDTAGRAFDATLSLRRREITGASLARVLARHPLMTVQVVAAIHFNALRLWRKGAPVQPHPRKAPQRAGSGA